MTNNYVRLAGTVRRDAEANAGRMEFTVEVPNLKGTKMWFDCVTTSSSPAFEALEGFVNEGEPIQVVGRLIKSTTTDHARVGTCNIETKTTRVLVYVDEVVTEEEE